MTSSDDVVRVLSIQSHVVHGYVGNRSAVFPLQLLGFEVDVINSVQFSTHTWYKSWKGSVMNDEDLDVLYQALKDNNLIKYDYILTGYIGSESFLRKVNEIIREMKQINPNLKYVCDPVMGDAGVMYVPEGLLPIYQKETLSLADVIIPNQWEAELLTGIKVTNESQVNDLISALHAAGPATVVLSSSDLGPVSKLVGFASKRTGEVKEYVRMEIPKLDAQFIGTGDLIAALWLSWSHHHPTNLKFVAEKVQSTMQHVLRRTLDAAKCSAGAGNAPTFADLELRLVQSKRDIEDPKIVVDVTNVCI